ncbi:MAG TPA: PQQ-binding-like beta-propeller repeat protein [Prolixibacteraceae bacterium]|nr:PQQ-binding-like beta-propeller repeat protein [Prolixibacteraceae bacterium]
MKHLTILLSVILLSVLAIAQPAQFRGPHRDGKFDETGLLKKWPDAGPQLLLKVEGIGKGFSSIVATDQYMFATGMIDTLDYLSCITPDGKLKWKVPYGRSWVKSFPDTRGSATVEGDRVYVISGTGQLSCLNVADGTTRWKVNVDKDYESEWHIWGVAESPLIVDDKVICSPGGNKTSIVAFDKMTGKPVWQSASVGGPRCYVSPTIFEYKQFRYILAATGTHLIALEPATGKVAWTFKYWDAAKWDQPGLIWANTPVIKGRDIFISKGYDYRNVMLEMSEDGKSVSEKWSNLVLDNHHHGLIELDGNIYGSNWENNSKGKWVCMDWQTGAVKYENDWNTKGAMVFADGMLYVMEEKSGTVGLVNPNPAKFEVVSSFKLNGGSGPFWSHPFIANGKLYLRHGDVLFVYNIKA